MHTIQRIIPVQLIQGNYNMFVHKRRHWLIKTSVKDVRNRSQPECQLIQQATR